MASTSFHIGDLLSALYVVTAILVAVYANRIFQSRPIGVWGDVAAAGLTTAAAAWFFNARFNALLLELDDDYPRIFTLAYMPFVAFAAIGFVRSLVPLIPALQAQPATILAMAGPGSPSEPMTAGIASDPVAADAPAPAKPESLLMKRVQTGVGIFILLTVVVIYLARFITRNDLPGCTDQTTRNVLSDIFKSKNLDVKRYDDTKTLSTADDLVTCTSAITLSNNNKAELDYQISFVEDKKVQVRITAARDK